MIRQDDWEVGRLRKSLAVRHPVAKRTKQDYGAAVLGSRLVDDVGTLDNENSVPP